MPELLYEFVGLLTKQPTEAELNKCMLSLRYHHRNELPSFVNFSVLLLSCRNLNSQREILYGIIEKIFKRLLLEADFFFILITYAKLLPLLAWAENRPQRQVDDCLGPAFRQLTKPVSAGKSKVVMNQGASKILSQHLMLLRFLDSKNFFLFYFQLINGTQDQEHNIDFYFLQLQTDIAEQSLLSSSEIAVMQRNFYLQYAKLRKRKYKEELIRAVYRWLELEVEVFKEEADTPANSLLFQTLSQAIRSQNNICGATLLQVLDSSLESFHQAKMHYFLELVDICIVEGTYKIATQTILFLLCTLFHKIHIKKVKASCLLVLQHLQLWKQVAIKRRLPSKLVDCLAQWLPFLYGSSRAVIKGEPELLQLYRKELIKLDYQSNLSEISELKLVIEELQFRKIDAIYAQLQEFHDEIAHPQVSKYPQKSSNNKIDFNYKPSGLSRSNSQINSLLNSLLSKATHSPNKSRHQQLQLLSKPHSLSGNGSLGSQRSFGEQVEIILSLIDLFDYCVRSVSHVTQEVSRASQYEQYLLDSSKNNHESNVLPIVSALEKLPSHTSQKDSRLGYSQLQKRQVSLNCPSQTEQVKKRMAKHRGLITKTKSMEIGYLFQAQQSKLSFFVTLLHPTAKFSLILRGNSFKFKSSRAEILQPKPNKQYKLSYTLQGIKLYSLEGVENSQRLARSKMEVRLGDSEDSEVYDIPISVFNFIQWLDLLPEDEVLFDRPPVLETKWLPACPQFAKHGQDYLKRFCTFHRDKQGGFQLKSKFLGRKVLLRVLKVLGEVKVELLSDCVWLLWGLWQVLL